MMRFARWTSGRCRWVAPLVAGMVLAAGGAVHAQRKAASGDLDYPQELKNDERSKLQYLRDGRFPVGDADKKLLDKAAQFYVYRLTNHQAQFLKPDSKQQGINKLVEEALQHIPDVKKRPSKPDQAQNQQQYLREFSDRLAFHILKLLDKADEPIARVNAAIILSKLGETGLEELADPLCKVVEDQGQLDGVRLYAMRGMKNLFDARVAEGFKDDKGEERLIKCVKALVDFLKRKPTYDAKTATEAERDAFRYVRREAVRALGATRLPEVAKRGTPENRPALELLRVIARDGLEPPPSLSERVEAAIAVCHMQTEKFNKYQPEYAAYFIGRLVVDMATQYDKDRGQDSRFDYRYYAYILKDALGALKTETRGKITFVNEVINRSTPILNSIYANTPTDYRGFSDWLGQVKPPSTELFKGKPETAVKEGASEPALKTAPGAPPPQK